jgi:ATP-dependent Clp protease ATP-binding subunit ClpC
MPRRSDSELSKLRKLAHARAQQRNERPTTVHLLAAVAGVPGPAQTLLLRRKLEEEKVLRAARTFDEEISEAVGRVLDGARDVARRSAVPSRAAVATSRGGVARPTAAPQPSGLHVLVVLLSNRRYAAYRALAQLGVDISRLRTLAMQMAAGVVALPRTTDDERRRSELHQSGVRTPRGEPRNSTSATTRPASRPRPKRPATAVQVPLVPPLSTVRQPPAVPPPSIPPSDPVPSVHEPNRGAPFVAPAPSSKPARLDELPRGAAASSPLDLDPEEFPVLSVLGKNLTAAADRG